MAYNEYPGLSTARMLKSDDGTFESLYAYSLGQNIDHTTLFKVKANSFYYTLRLFH